MRIWLGWRKRRLRDFAAAIRPELGEMPTLTPSEDLLERILTSRRAGIRMILPHDAPPLRRPAFRYVAALVAAAALVAVVSRLARRDGLDPDAVASAHSWFAGVALAQPPLAVYPPVRLTNPDGLRPLTIEYARVARVPGAVDRTTAHIRVTMDRDSAGGVPAWRVVSVDRDATGSSRTGIDTVYVARSDLRPLQSAGHQAPYHSYSRISIAQRLDGRRIAGDMTAEREGRVVAHRTFDRVLPERLAPYVTDAFAPFYLMAVPLEAGWRGRLSLLGWAVRDDDVATPMEMRVDGEETIRVPAGEFRCWRIAIEIGGQRHWYWVRRSDGLGVRSITPAGKDGRPAQEISLVKES